MLLHDVKKVVIFLKSKRILITGIVLFFTGFISLQLLIFKPFGCLYGKTPDGCAAAELDLVITIIIVCIMLVGWIFLIYGIFSRLKNTPDT